MYVIRPGKAIEEKLEAAARNYSQTVEEFIADAIAEYLEDAEDYKLGMEIVKVAEDDSETDL